jgi:hypothetical protein
MVEGSDVCGIGSLCLVFCDCSLRNCSCQYRFVTVAVDILLQYACGQVVVSGLRARSRGCVCVLETASVRCIHFWK